MIFGEINTGNDAEIPNRKIMQNKLQAQNDLLKMETITKPRPKLLSAER